MVSYKKGVSYIPQALLFLNYIKDIHKVLDTVVSIYYLLFLYIVYTIMVHEIEQYVKIKPLDAIYKLQPPSITNCCPVT